MAFDLATLYDEAAQKYARDARECNRQAEVKREQIKSAPIDSQLALLTEAVILDRAGFYLDSLAEDLLESAKTMRDPL